MVGLKNFSHEKLGTMAAAGKQVLECYRVLQKSDTNMVAEVLRGQGTFYELDHYPEGDAYDSGNAEYYSEFW